MADLYAISRDEADGSVITHLYDKGTAYFWVNRGGRPATEDETNKAVAALQSSPQWLYYTRQVIAQPDKPRVEPQENLINWYQGKVGKATRTVAENIPVIEAFAAKVGATEANIGTGELIGNRPLTKAEKEEWKALSVGTTKAAYDEAFYQNQVAEEKMGVGFMKPNHWKPQDNPNAAWNVGETAPVSDITRATKSRSMRGRRSTGGSLGKAGHTQGAVKDLGKDFRKEAGVSTKEVMSEAVEVGKSVASGGMEVSGWYPITRPVSSSRQVEGLPQSHGRLWASLTKIVK